MKPKTLALIGAGILTLRSEDIKPKNFLLDGTNKIPLIEVTEGFKVETRIPANTNLNNEINIAIENLKKKYSPPEENWTWTNKTIFPTNELPISTIIRSTVFTNNWVTYEWTTNGMKQIGQRQTNKEAVVIYKGKTNIMFLEIEGKEEFPTGKRTILNQPLPAVPQLQIIRYDDGKDPSVNQMFKSIEEKAKNK